MDECGTQMSVGDTGVPHRALGGQPALNAYSGLFTHTQALEV